MELGRRPEELEVQVLVQNEQDELVKIKVKLPEGKTELDEHQLAELVESVLEEKTQDGTVAISNGQVVIRVPVKGGRYPSITPGPETRVMINGQLIQKETMVSPRDRVVVSAEDRPPLRLAEVQLTPDKLEAYLAITYASGAKMKIPDQPPQTRLTVRAEAVQILEPVPFTTTELVNILKEHGVVYGVDIQAVEQARLNGGRYLVARGRPMVPGEAGKIEYYFLDETQQARLDEMEEEQRINFYEHRTIPSVEAGEILARKYPARPGRPGMTVTGEMIPVPEYKEPQLLVKQGATLMEDGQVAVAVTAGRPILKNSVISVLPIYTVQGDVNLASGNVRFDGHVVVWGNVMDGASVIAGGDVEIHGNVTQGSVQARGNITVHKNVVGATLVAGGMDAINSEIIYRLREIKGELESLLLAVVQLKQHPAFGSEDLARYGLGRLLRILLDQKFATLPKLILQIVQMLQNQSPSDSLNEIIRLVARKFVGLGVLEVADELEIQEAILRLEKEIIDLEATINSASDIKLAYAHNSKLEASGKIVFTGQGAYMCQVSAGGDVLAEKKDSIYRGGRLIVTGNAVLNELGSPMATPTTVEFVFGRRILVNRVYPGVSFRVGRQLVKVQEVLRDVRVAVDEQGILRVDYLYKEHVQ